MGKGVTWLFVVVFLTAFITVDVVPFWASAEITEDTWTRKAWMDVGRSGLGLAVVDGKIYAIGGDARHGKSNGRSDYRGSIVGTNEEYDPATDTWTRRRSMPTPRSDFAIAVYRNKIYCIGGLMENGEYTGAVEVYDPDTTLWETKSSMPTVRFEPSANVVNGKIYVMGGYNPAIYGPNSTSNLNEVYDPETDSWATKAPLPVGTRDCPSAVVDNKIYLIGGWTNENQIYDPETDTWSTGTPPPGGCGGHEAAVATTDVYAPKRIYCFNDVEMVNSVTPKIYDPDCDSWTTGAELPTTRHDFGVAVVNDLIYVMGGHTRELLGICTPGDILTQYRTNEQYTPLGYGTVPPKISIVSPENRTYPQNLSLNFTVNKPVDWAGYSLDDQNNVTIQGNTTLTCLSEGTHRLTLYAEDQMNNTGVSPPLHFTVDTTLPLISLLSPGNMTYSDTEVGLNFTSSEPISWVGYSLDGEDKVTLNGNTTLSGLSDGDHRLMVYMEDMVGNTGASDIVYFTVDTIPPTISVVSPQNQTYTITSIPLNFTVDEPSSQIWYSLDGRENATIQGNVTLSDLSEGSHWLTVYANDTVGNMGASETIYFNVTQKTYPVSWLITVLVAAVIVGVVWWGYRRTIQEEIV